MTKLHRGWFVIVLALGTFASIAQAGLLLNEIYLNPPATDDAREYVEITRTSPADSLAGVWLIEIDGDGNNAGFVDNARELTTADFGANGLLWVGQNYGTSGPPWPNTPAFKFDLARPGDPTLENGSITFLLVTGFNGVVGTDYDANNDGILESAPWTTMLDSVGWNDGGSNDCVYSAASLVQSSGTPDAASRFPGDARTSEFGAWFCGDILATPGNPVPDFATAYDAAKASANLPPGAELTPGFANVPEPAALALLLALGAVATRRGR